MVAVAQGSSVGHDLADACADHAYAADPGAGVTKKSWCIPDA
jgi:hypothetical protein